MAIVTIAVDNERLDDNNRLLIKNEEHNDVQRNSRSFCEGFSVGARQHNFLRFTATPSSHKLGHVPRELLRPHGGQVHARVPCPCAVMAGHGGDRPRARAAVALVSGRGEVRHPGAVSGRLPETSLSSEARHTVCAGREGAPPRCWPRALTARSDLYTSTYQPESGHRDLHRSPEGSRPTAPPRLILLPCGPVEEARPDV